ncbi:MAG: TIGR04283 family arsenosugar biosynthesis glycosyltransferase [bacterium]
MSVIVPTLNEAENIRATIAAAGWGYTAEDLEIVVVDAESTDGTADAARGQFEALLVLQSSPGRGLQMNRGVAASHGDILVFCHADTLLPRGWLEAVRAATACPGTSGGSFRPMFVPADRPMLRLLNRLPHPKNWRLIWGDQVQFTTRDTFEAVGGFKEIPLMEDVEMARALKRRGKMAKLRLRVETSSRKFEEVGATRHIFRSLWFVFSYLYLGADPSELAERYRTPPRIQNLDERP